MFRSLLRTAAAPAVTGLVCFALLLGTSGIQPMAWDEGNAIDRARGIREWFGELRRTGIAVLGDEPLARHWHYTVEIEGHPAGYGCLIALGEWSAGAVAPWIGPLSAARLGPMLLYSLAAGAMFHRLRRQFSLVAALGGAAGLVLLPRLFAHAHFASFDGPLTACWILAWATFAPAIEKGRRAALWGAALGLTMSMKFTGWLAPLPFIVYALVYGDRRAVRTLAIGGAVAHAVFWLLNPRLWWHPIDGTLAFFKLNLGRAGTGLDIPTLFFGRRYSMLEPLPWYNTLVWTGITVPVGLLALAIVGVAGVLRRWAVDGHGVLLFLNWLVLVVVRALPGAPVHDAERLFLPSFAFLAALAGVGCHVVAGVFGKRAGHVSGASMRSENLESRIENRRHTGASRFSILASRFPASFFQRSVIAGLIAIYAGAATSVAWYAPQWLSYYNLLIGGLRGADAAGFEATYYWDALDRELLDWLDAHTGDDETIEFANGAPINLKLLREWGKLHRDWTRGPFGQGRWYVLQRRSTFWQAGDRWLIEHESPVFSKTICSPTAGIGPWRLDVPLIEVFSDDQRRRAVSEPYQPGSTRR